MKITKRQLRRIIKEEKARILREFDPGRYVNAAHELWDRIRDERDRLADEAPHILNRLEVPPEGSVMDSPDMFQQDFENVLAQLEDVNRALQNLSKSGW